MNVRSPVLIGLALGTALTVGLACSGGTGDSTAPPTGTGGTPPPPPPTQPPPPAPPPDEGVLPPPHSKANFNILDDTFVDEAGRHDQEAQATVKAGDTVSWTHNGRDIHRVEFSLVPDEAQSPDSGDLRSASSWTFRPTVPGTYVFFCRYHEYMMDVKIHVEAVVP